MSYRDDFRQAERDTWWSLPRAFAVLFAVIVFFYAIGFLATGGDLFIYKFWAPKQEDAKREVFQNTQSYVQGKTEYLARLRREYQDADDSRKPSLRTLILDESSTVDVTKLPIDLQLFLRSL